jgi:protein-tyrosine phosphatase
MEGAMRNGGCVYVHCADESLSAAFIIAYLMRYERLSALQATQVVSLARPTVQLHGGIRRQIGVYEENLRHSKQRAVLLMSNML